MAFQDAVRVINQQTFFDSPLTAMSIQGGGATIVQTSATTLYLESPVVNPSIIRISYVAT